MKNVTVTYCVVSTNFQHHTPLPAANYAAALELAKHRGFDAQIYGKVGSRDHVLVASWSALYGTKVYNRELAGDTTPAILPKSKTMADGSVLHLTYRRDGKPVYVSIPERVRS